MAKTIQEQLIILRNRGMIFDNGEPFAISKLQEIGYYKLGFYWHYFEIDSNHNFKDGLKFSTIIKLYEIDTELQYILTRALNFIEVHFKSQLIYHVSNYYKNIPAWFMDSSVINQKFIQEFPTKTYTTKFIAKHKPIAKHHIKYPSDQYAPAWKTLEYLTFGTIELIFKNLKSNDLQKQISNLYGIKNVSIFNNFLRTIVFIRNKCAHGDVLYDSNTPFQISIQFPSILFKTGDHNSLYNSIKIIEYFLGKISSNEKSDLKNRINNNLFRYPNDQDLNQIITTKMKY